MKSALTIHLSKTVQEGKSESVYVGEPTRKAINTAHVQLLDTIHKVLEDR